MKSFLLLSVALFVAGAAQAQHMLGIQSGNYAGLNSLSRNPAAIADSRMGFSFHLSSIDLSITNNYARYNSKTSLYKLLLKGEDMHEDDIERVSNGKPKFLTASSDYRGPSFMLALSPKHSIGISTRVRGSFQLSNVSEPLAHLISSRSNNDELLSQAQYNNHFSLNANANAEIGFTYARVLLNQNHHLFKAGATVKKVSGMYSAYFINKNMTFRYDERPDANYVEVDQFHAEYGYLNEEFSDNFTTNKALGWLFDGNAPGNGWGFDLGFSYEYRPEIEKYETTMPSKDRYNPRKNKYKYRVDVSLMDVGSVKYDNPAYTRSITVQADKKEINLDDFDNAETSDEYAGVVNKALDVRPEHNKRSFTSGLPTALHVNIDYKVAGPVYVNAAIVQNLRDRLAIGMRQHSVAALTPRFETKYFEVSLPMSLHNDYQVFGMGAMVRVWNLFVGSDNIGGLLNIGKPYGANFYAGFTLLNIYRGKKEPKAPKAKKETKA